MLASKVGRQESFCFGYLLQNFVALPSQLQLANIAKAIVGEKNIKFQNIIQVVFHPAWQSRFYDYKK